MENLSLKQLIFALCCLSYLTSVVQISAGKRSANGRVTVGSGKKRPSVFDIVSSTSFKKKNACLTRANISLSKDMNRALQDNAEILKSNNTLLQYVASRDQDIQALSQRAHAAEERANAEQVRAAMAETAAQAAQATAKKAIADKKAAEKLVTKAAAMQEHAEKASLEIEKTISVRCAVFADENRTHEERARHDAKVLAKKDEEIAHLKFKHRMNRDARLGQENKRLKK